MEVFDVLTDPSRRRILDLLREREHLVGELVEDLGLSQPGVSKHLRVLREVGLVDVRDVGRQRLYRLNGRALKPIYDWVKAFEQTWNERYDALDELLEELKEMEGDNGGSGE